jgi:hypothetical protein
MSSGASSVGMGASSGASSVGMGASSGVGRLARRGSISQLFSSNAKGKASSGASAGANGGGSTTNLHDQVSAAEPRTINTGGMKLFCTKSFLLLSSP